MGNSNYYKSLIDQKYADIQKEEAKINTILSTISKDNGIVFTPIQFFSSIITTTKDTKSIVIDKNSATAQDDAKVTYTKIENPNDENTQKIDETEIYENVLANVNSKDLLVSADSYLKTISDNNGIVKIDGYSYDVNTHDLTDPKGNKVKVNYLLPKGADLSKLNTMTVMGGADDTGVANKNSRWNGLNNYSSNSLIVCPQRNKDKSYCEYPIASATTFGSLFTGNKNSVNTIIGTSAGGGAAVKIAATNPGVYKNVISCNYEPLCKECGKSFDKGGLLKLTDNDIRSLASQDIKLTYINCSGDPNISTKDEYSGGTFKVSAPHFINVVSGCQNINPNFKMQFLSNIDGGYTTDKFLGTWTSGNKYVSFSNNTNDFAKFLGINYTAANKIYGHGNGCFDMLKALIEKGC